MTTEQLILERIRVRLTEQYETYLYANRDNLHLDSTKQQITQRAEEIELIRKLIKVGTLLAIQ